MLVRSGASRVILLQGGDKAGGNRPPHFHSPGAGGREEKKKTKDVKVFGTKITSLFNPFHRGAGADGRPRLKKGIFGGGKGGFPWGDGGHTFQGVFGVEFCTHGLPKN